MDHMKFRECYVLYFVEDGTMKVFEPRQKNTGFLQGCILNRNMMPKPEGGYYALEDLNVGETLVLFGKSFKLLDCDSFTRTFLTEMGFRVKNPEPGMKDPVLADREQADKPQTCRRRSGQKNFTLRTFCRNFPKVLHFFGMYERSAAHLEDKRFISLYYSLTDGTIKIVDAQKIPEYKHCLRNGAYDNYVILRPTRVPKNMTQINFPGDICDPVVLNLSAKTKDTRLRELLLSSQNKMDKSAFITDSNPLLEQKNFIQYYTSEDLDLGIAINIFGARVYLYDCDEFTKEFYRTEFNKELVPVSLPEIEHPKYHKLVYPQQLGSQEDSLITCHGVESIKGKRDFVLNYELSKKVPERGSRLKQQLKFFLNCRDGCDGKELRYLAHILTNDVLKKNPILIIKYFLEDDTIEITGPHMNFWIMSKEKNRYMKRMKVVKPTCQPKNSNHCYYSAKDMYVGNIICVENEAVCLCDADEYTYDYMENHCDVFVHSNIAQIKSTFKTFLKDKAIIMKTAFENADGGKIGFIKYDDFKTILYQNLPEDIRDKIPEQQIVTLARHFAYEEDVGLKFEDLLSKMQTELRKKRYQEFDRLKLQFEIFEIDNSENKGYFKPSVVYDILRSNPLPVNRDLIKCFILKFPTQNGLIDYTKLINHLDYIKNPTKLSDMMPSAININWRGNEKRKIIQKICYDSFLKNLTKEKCPK
ncbi:EF-hand domain-containing family member C2, partial [Stegodyphus mimosarum]